MTQLSTIAAGAIWDGWQSRERRPHTGDNRTSSEGYDESLLGVPASAVWRKAKGRGKPRPRPWIGCWAIPAMEVAPRTDAIARFASERVAGTFLSPSSWVQAIVRLYWCC